MVSGDDAPETNQKKHFSVKNTNQMMSTSPAESKSISASGKMDLPDEEGAATFIFMYLLRRRK